MYLIKRATPLLGHLGVMRVVGKRFGWPLQPMWMQSWVLTSYCSPVMPDIIYIRLLDKDIIWL